MIIKENVLSILNIFHLTSNGANNCSEDYVSGIIGCQMGAVLQSFICISCQADLTNLEMC